MEQPASAFTKRCPICELDLPITQFGVCRARKDGRNLYCKTCIRNKVTKSRRALREYKSARNRVIAQHTRAAELIHGEGSSAPYSARALSRLTPVERVRDAIRKGARTQREIAQETKLGKDEIGDALANLLLWTREIRTQIVDGGTRIYVLNESAEGADVGEGGTPPKHDIPSSFSHLQGLMPGRNSKGDEPEKIGGWVAV